MLGRICCPKWIEVAMIEESEILYYYEYLISIPIAWGLGGLKVISAFEGCLRGRKFQLREGDAKCKASKHRQLSFELQIVVRLMISE